MGALAILPGLTWGGWESATGSNIRKTNIPNNTEKKICLQSRKKLASV